MAGWVLCATQQRAEAASKCSPWQRSAHTGPELQVPGATEGCEITMINNYNYLQMCQLLLRSGCL